MKQKQWNVLTVSLFAVLLAAIPLYWLIAPRRTFSDSERRYLKEPPKLAGQSLSEWTFDDDMESYLADQLPLRDALVGVNAYAALLSGRQIASEIYSDADGYLVEEPVVDAPEEVEKRLSRIVKAGENAGLTPYLIVVPSTGYVRRDKLPQTVAALYRDDVILGRIAGRDGITLVPLLDRFLAEGRTWYYRTDHHWNADGAFAAYEAFMETAGHTPLDREAFYHHTVRGYSGSTRSRSALWLHRTDTLTIDEPIDCPVSVTFSDSDGTYDSMFFYDHLGEYDWYPLFLDGNHPVTVIENLAAAEDMPSLLLIKDSFGNSLAPLLVPSYRRVVMVDPRYYKRGVAPLCETYGLNEMLVCYSLFHITTDDSLKLLK